MQDLFRWSNEIFKRDASLNWLEVCSENFTPLLSQSLKFLLNGWTFVVITDEKRRYFVDFFTRKINSKEHDNRPLLPFFSIFALCPNVIETKNLNELKLVDDMLNIAFNDKILYFYIGDNKSEFYQLAKINQNSYIWLIDTLEENSFYLSSKNDDLDFKLLQLYKIFDSAIDAVLFNEVIL